MRNKHRVHLLNLLMTRYLFIFEEVSMAGKPFTLTQVSIIIQVKDGLILVKHKPNSRF